MSGGYWALHVVEAIVFSCLAFGISLALIGLLFWLCKGMIFSYLDELDYLATMVDPDHANSRNVSRETKAEIGRSLAIFSAAKMVAIGLIMLAITLAAT